MAVDGGKASTLAQGTDVVQVSVEAEDERGHTFSWPFAGSSCLSCTEPVREVAQRWAAAHCVPKDVVGLADDKEQVLDLESTPVAFGWPASPTVVRLKAFPNDKRYAEGSTEPLPTPVKPKEAPLQRQEQVEEPASSKLEKTVDPVTPSSSRLAQNQRLAQRKRPAPAAASSPDADAEGAAAGQTSMPPDGGSAEKAPMKRRALAAAAAATTQTAAESRPAESGAVDGSASLTVVQPPIRPTDADAAAPEKSSSPKCLEGTAKQSAEPHVAVDSKTEKSSVPMSLGLEGTVKQAKPPTVAVGSKATPKVASGSGEAPQPTGDEAIAYQQTNPKRPGSASHARYEKYKAAKTSNEALSLGAAKGDLKDDWKKGLYKRVDQH